VAAGSDRSTSLSHSSVTAGQDSDLTQNTARPANAGRRRLLVGLVAPLVGIVAAVGLVAYFVGAVITVVRAGRYSHVPFPLVYMAPVVGSLTVGLAA
jgi:DoxX-like family